MGLSGYSGFDNKFHDEDYDGISLKIPNGILLTNPDLEPHIEAFKKALIECDYSNMMPDHRMNVNELENYKEKSKIIRKRRADKKEDDRIRMEKENKKISDWLSHRVLRKSTRKMECYIDTDRDFVIKDRFYGNEEMYTRTGLKSAFKKAYKEFVESATLEEFKKMMEDNGIYLLFHIHIPIHKIEFSKSYLSVNTMGDLNLIVQVPSVDIFKKGKGKNDQIYFNTALLLYNEEEDKLYIAGNYLKDSIRVDFTSSNTSGTSYENVSRLEDYNEDNLNYTLKDK